MDVTKTLRLYSKNRKMPRAVKLGTVSNDWLEYAKNLALSLENTSDVARAQRESLGVKGTELIDYSSLIKFYNQRYISEILLPSEIKKLDNVHHLRFGILTQDNTIPYHLDEPFTLRFICMIHGNHKFHFRNLETYEMIQGEIWFINGSFEHSVENTTNGDRIALLGKMANNEMNQRLIYELL